MNAVLNIPNHTKCTNCGKCCGPVPITGHDVARIKRYIQDNPYPIRAMKQRHGPMECIFRDTEKKACSIYAVRPMVCRLFGVAKGLHCPNGNSAEIDGHKFLDFNAEYYGDQNNFDWGIEDNV